MYTYKFKRIITHAGCADGMASAIILHDAFPDAKIEFVNYNTDAHVNMNIERNMLFCDFTPHKSKLQDCIDNEVVVLDHHVGAADLVRSLGKNGIYSDAPGVSGAVLACELWKLAKNDTNPIMEFFAQLAGVRDTWQKQSPLWNDSCAQQQALTFFPAESWLACKFWDEEFKKMYDVRYALLNKHKQTVTNALRNGTNIRTVSGLSGLMIDRTDLTSDVAEECRQDSSHKDLDFVVGYGTAVTSRGLHLVASLRSVKPGFSVLEIAKRNGGGGHKEAAGFMWAPIISDNPATLFSQIL